MKQAINTLKIILAMGLFAIMAGCATSQSKENALVAAGFKVITPKNAKQEAKLKALPVNKVTMVKKDGKIFYVYPDVANNVAYVGGPKQYQAYRQYQQQNQIANEQVEAAEMNQDAASDWGAWGGWGGWEGAGYGWY